MAKLYAYDYKTATFTKFRKRYFDCQNRGHVMHKWRILLEYGLDFRRYRTQLKADDVKDWKRKLEFIEHKIQEGFTKIIDMTLQLSIQNEQPKILMDLLDRESSNIFEEQQQQQLNLTNITIALPQKEDKPIDMKVVEVNAKKL